MTRSCVTVKHPGHSTRRKSCTNCIRAKRRCDLGRPACQRCSRLDVQCRYAGPVERAQRKPRRTTRTLKAPDGNGFFLNDQVDRSNSDVAVGEVLPSVWFGLDTSHYGHILDVGSIGLEGYSTLRQTELPLVASPRTLYSFISPVGSYLTSSRPKSSWPETMSWAVMERRFRYSLDEMIRAPKRMVQENATPWCHPQLYRDEMPRSMQDAQACCALYEAKNSSNEASFLRTVNNRASELIIDSLLPSTSILDALARTQALLLYQIMRLFDKDVSTRAAAEQAMPHLTATVLDLLQYLLPGGSREAFPETSHLPLYPLSATCDFWSSWILHESAQRTVIVTTFMMQLYARLQPQGLRIPPICDQRVCDSCVWTGSAHLWKAANAVDFQRVWEQRKHFLVTVSNVESFLDEAEADDVDVYDRVLLTAIKGIEEVRGWFLSKGGSL